MKNILYLLLAALGGILTALSLPPFNLWYLAFLGLLIFAFTLRTNLKQRFFLSLVFFITYYLISLFFISFFSIPGYLVVVLFEAILFSVLISICLPDKIFTNSYFSYGFAFASCLTFSEIIKDSFPFGGLPLGSIALAFMSSPFKYLAIIGGSTVIIFIVSLLSSWLSALITSIKAKKLKITAFLTIAICIVLFTQEPLALSTRSLIRLNHISVGLVQGGGQVGLHAVTQGDPEEVFIRQVNETQALLNVSDVNLILWPEDTVALNGPISESLKIPVVRSLAQKCHCYLIAGVTIPVGDKYFYNQAIEFSPSGQIVGRYEKIHRVPFGEYVPFRSFFSHFGPTNLVPRDAIAGTKPGILRTPFATLGLMISYEVFFGNLARNDVKSNATLLVVPTNTASYKISQVPEQELAADKIRAIETGRYLIQASPTGFTDVIDINGNVLKVSPLKKPFFIRSVVYNYTGNTFYDTVGKSFFIIIYLIVYVLSLAVSLRRFFRNASRIKSSHLS